MHPPFLPLRKKKNTQLNNPRKFRTNVSSGKRFTFLTILKKCFELFPIVTIYDRFFSLLHFSYFSIFSSQLRWNLIRIFAINHVSALWAIIFFLHFAMQIRWEPDLWPENEFAPIRNRTAAEC